MIRNEIFVGMAAMCWALWLCRNDVGFNGTKTETLLYMDIRGHNGFSLNLKIRSELNKASSIMENVEQGHWQRQLTS